MTAKELRRVILETSREFHDEVANQCHETMKNLPSFSEEWERLQAMGKNHRLMSTAVTNLLGKK